MIVVNCPYCRCLREVNQVDFGSRTEVVCTTCHGTIEIKDKSRKE